MRRIALFLVLSLALVACGDSQVDESAYVRVGVNDFASLLDSPPADDITLIDLRTAEEIAAGYIDGASQLDFYAADFEQRLDALPRDGHYLIYCNSGNRSGTALRLMKDLGFEQVTELDGGIQAWMSSEQPMTRP
ncbi:MAG: rhodanese-like domain-containing protein [Acidimicrobiia bacterium]|nr:rhodanese-like domain-containing protein [Acidimicrobiia bacterium]